MEDKEKNLNPLSCTSHPLKGKTVKLKASDDFPPGTTIDIEDYWHLVGEQYWLTSATSGNAAALGYMIRLSGRPDLPRDNEVLYGKIETGPAHFSFHLGYLVHVSEIELEK